MLSDVLKPKNLNDVKKEVFFYMEEQIKKGNLPLHSSQLDNIARGRRSQVEKKFWTLLPFKVNASENFRIISHYNGDYIGIRGFIKNIYNIKTFNIWHTNGPTINVKYTTQKIHIEKRLNCVMAYLPEQKIIIQYVSPIDFIIRFDYDFLVEHLGYKHLHYENNKENSKKRETSFCDRNESWRS